MADGWRQVGLGLLALLGVVAVPPAAALDDALTGYRWSAPLAVPGNGQGVHRVPLPLDWLQRSRSADLADVRVFNSAGEPVPIAWAPPAAPLHRPAPSLVPLPLFPWPGRLGEAGPDAADVRVELRADGSVIKVERRKHAPRTGQETAAWLIDLSPLRGQVAQAIELGWDANGASVIREIRAQASSDARHWTPVGEATLLELHDAASGQTVLQRRVVLTGIESGQRYLRLSADGALTLQRVDAETRSPKTQTTLDSARFALSRGTGREWTLDSGAVLHVQRMQVQLPQDNSVAPLAVERRAPGAVGREAETWHPVTRHLAYRLLRDGAALVSPPLDLDTTAREWRFLLDERVAPPDGPMQVTLWWAAPQLLFAARGAPPFTLAIGREQAASAALDPSSLLPGEPDAAERTLPLGTIGTAAEHARAERSWREVLAQSTKKDLQRWALWSTLALAIVLLGALAWRLARDLQPKHDAP